MNISVSTPCSATVMDEISPMKNKSIYIFLYDNNDKHFLYHFIGEASNLMKTLILSILKFNT